MEHIFSNKDKSKEGLFGDIRTDMVEALTWQDIPSLSVHALHASLQRPVYDWL